MRRRFRGSFSRRRSGRPAEAQLLELVGDEPSGRGAGVRSRRSAISWTPGPSTELPGQGGGRGRGTQPRGRRGGVAAGAMAWGGPRGGALCALGGIGATEHSSDRSERTCQSAIRALTRRNGNGRPGISRRSRGTASRPQYLQARPRDTKSRPRCATSRGGTATTRVFSLGRSLDEPVELVVGGGPDALLQFLDQREFNPGVDLGPSLFKGGL